MSGRNVSAPIGWPSAPASCELTALHALADLPEAPLVSAVIPVHDGAGFVSDAIASVFRQTWPRMECIVVDDGSTDGTPEAVKAVGGDRVRYIGQPRSGVSRARNRGIAEARGDLVAFLDADDVWLPEKTSQQLEAFRTNPGLGLVLTDFLMVNSVLRRPVCVSVDPTRRGLRKVLLMEAAGTGLSFTGMVRREVAEAVGGFDPRFSVSADLEFTLRVAERFPVAAVNRPLALYRIHDRQMHLDLNALERDRRQLFDLVLPLNSGHARDRRRATANLYTRLFFYQLKRQDWTAAARALTLATAQLQPHSSVGLMTWAAATRLRRRLAVRAGPEELPWTSGPLSEPARNGSCRSASP